MAKTLIHPFEADTLAYLDDLKDKLAKARDPAMRSRLEDAIVAGRRSLAAFWAREWRDKTRDAA
jgi:hypothetical protein